MRRDAKSERNVGWFVMSCPSGQLAWKGLFRIDEGSLELVTSMTLCGGLLTTNDYGFLHHFLSKQDPLASS